MASSPVELVLAKLPEAKRNQKGWNVQCPAHEDRRPSLSIAEGDDGRALLHCHAGCTAEQITEALGLTLADLMPPSSAKRRGKTHNGERRPRHVKAPGPVPTGQGKSFNTARDAVAEADHVQQR